MDTYTPRRLREVLATTILPLSQELDALVDDLIKQGYMSNIFTYFYTTKNTQTIQSEIDTLDILINSGRGD